MDNDKKRNVIYANDFFKSLTETIETAHGDGNSLSFWLGSIIGYEIGDVIPLEIAVDKMFGSRIAIIRYDDMDNLCTVMYSYDETPETFATAILGKLAEEYLPDSPKAVLFATAVPYDCKLNRCGDEQALLGKYLDIAYVYNNQKGDRSICDLDVMLRLIDLSVNEQVTVGQLEYFMLSTEDNTIPVAALRDQLPTGFTIYEWVSCRGEECIKCGKHLTRPTGYMPISNNGRSGIAYRLKCTECGHEFISL